MTKSQLQLVGLVMLAFTLGSNEFIILGIVSDLAREFHVSVSAVGYLITMYALVYAAGIPVMMSLTSKWGNYTKLIVFLATFTVSNFVSAMTVNYVTFAISRVVSALLIGTLIALALSFTTQIAEAHHRSKLVTWIFSGFSIASVLGVPLYAFITTHFSWRFSFVVIGVVSFMVTILLAFILPKWHGVSADSVVKQFAIFKDVQILLGMAIVIFSAAGVYAFYTYLEPILRDILHFNSNIISLILVIYGATALISNQLSGYLDRRFGLPGVSITALVTIGLFILSRLLLHFTAAGLVLLLLLGVAMYLFGSPVTMHFLTVAEKKYPAALVLASSVYPISFNLGISLGSAVGAAMVAGFGLSSIFFGAIALTVVAYGASLYLNRKEV